MTATAARGAQAEQTAAAFLRGRGLRILARNYRVAGGEIDLIARHGAELVFVEVRSRRSAAFGSAAESVTPAKRRRLLLAAQHYLATLGQRTPPPCRFDVISITGTVDAQHLEWLRDAFSND